MHSPDITNGAISKGTHEMTVAASVKRAECIGLLCALSWAPTSTTQCSMPRLTPATLPIERPRINRYPFSAYWMPREVEYRLCSLFSSIIRPQTPTIAVCIEQSGAHNLNVRFAIDKASLLSNGRTLDYVVGQFQKIFQSLRGTQDDDHQNMATSDSVCLINKVDLTDVESQLVDTANGNAIDVVVDHEEIAQELESLVQQHPSLKNMHAIAHIPNDNLFADPPLPKNYRPNLDSVLCQLDREYSTGITGTAGLARGLGIDPTPENIQALQSCFSENATKSIQGGTVHAVIQLSTYYSSLLADSDRTPPRAIITTLDLCILSWMYMNLKGIFMIKGCHGLLVPDWSMGRAGDNPDGIFATPLADELELHVVRTLRKNTSQRYWSVMVDEPEPRKSELHPDSEDNLFGAVSEHGNQDESESTHGNQDGSKSESLQGQQDDLPDFAEVGELPVPHPGNSIHEILYGMCQQMGEPGFGTGHSTVPEIEDVEMTEAAEYISKVEDADTSSHVEVTKGDVSQEGLEDIVMKTEVTHGPLENVSKEVEKDVSKEKENKEPKGEEASVSKEVNRPREENEAKEMSEEARIQERKRLKEERRLEQERHIALKAERKKILQEEEKNKEAVRKLREEQRQKRRQQQEEFIALKEARKNARTEEEQQTVGDQKIVEEKRLLKEQRRKENEESIVRKAERKKALEEEEEKLQQQRLIKEQIKEQRRKEQEECIARKAEKKKDLEEEERRIKRARLIKAARRKEHEENVALKAQKVKAKAEKKEPKKADETRAEELDEGEDAVVEDVQRQEV